MQFYPRQYITFAYSAIEAAIALAQILAAPLAAALLNLDGKGGLAGWQILFLVQGGATVLFAAVLRVHLPENVETAHFLSDADRHWLAQQQHGHHKPGVYTSTEVELSGPGDVMDRGANTSVVEGEDADAQLLPRKHQDSAVQQPRASEEPAGPEAASGVLRPAQQILATARNPKILYLVCIKVLKVRIQVHCRTIKASPARPVCSAETPSGGEH